ncbi:DMT family transporter [Brucellaceae bacterium C25G]
MNRLMQSALFLLVSTGALLGLTLPFGKIAAQLHISPFMWAFVISAGAGLILLGVLLAKGKGLNFTSHHLRYYFIAAAISYAVPNVMVLSVIPHLGAGFTGIMYTLSPVTTLLLSVLLGLKRPNYLGVAGIAVGFLGALLVAITRGETGSVAEPLWLLIALLIPVILGLGNVYRTIDWPKGADPVELACGSHLAAALLLMLGMFFVEGGVPLGQLMAAPWMVLVQALVSALMFALYFQLQIVGGPVYLSQMGYVAAAVGLISGTLFMDEHYQMLTWIGALVIALGVTFTTKAQKAQTKIL